MIFVHISKTYAKKQVIPEPLYEAVDVVTLLVGSVRHWIRKFCFPENERF